MNQSKPYKVRRNKRLLSRLLADAAFPVLVLAVAVSQVKIGHHKKDALRQHGRQSGEVQAENGFQRSGDKYGSRAATGNSPVEGRTGSDKESSQDQ
jgi:hypothetical protein